jgi:hypothetical protein
MLVRCCKASYGTVCRTWVWTQYQTYLKAVPSLKYSSSSSSSEIGRRVRLAARDVAGEATADPVFEVAPEAMREAVLRDTVLLLSRALLRRSRMVKYIWTNSLSLKKFWKKCWVWPVRLQGELAVQMRGTRVKGRSYCHGKESVNFDV